MSENKVDEILEISTDKEQAQSSTVNTQVSKTNCTLATTLRVIGLLNVIGGIIMGCSLYKETVYRATKYFDRWPETHYHYDLLFGSIIVGVFGCIVCFALAKCVQAATVYLNSVAPKDKTTKHWLRSTIFDEEPTDTPQQD